MNKIAMTGLSSNAPRGSARCAHSTGLDTNDFIPPPFWAYDSAMCEKPAIDPDLVVRVAHMVTEWERSDELPSEFAVRLIYFFRELDTSIAKDCA